MRVTSSPPSNRSLEKVLKTAEYSGKLSLTNRRLKEIGQLVLKYNFFNITDVDLARNRLSEIPPEVFEWQCVSTLTLSHNLIKTVSDDITELKLLEVLNLDNNSLTVLPPQICDLHYLTMIRLSGNKLLALPQEIGRLKNCQELDVSMNHLTSIPKEIAQMSSLLYLNVRRNSILSLPEELSTIQLTHLNAGCNLITVIPIGFQKMVALRRLVLDNNPLSSPSLSVLRKGQVHLFRELGAQAEKAQIKDVTDDQPVAPAEQSNSINCDVSIIEIQPSALSVVEEKKEEEKQLDVTVETTHEQRKGGSPILSPKKKPSPKKSSPKRQKSANSILTTPPSTKPKPPAKDAALEGRKRSKSDVKFERKSSNEALLIHQNLSGFPGYKPHATNEKTETATNGSTPGNKAKVSELSKNREVSSQVSNKKSASTPTTNTKKGFIPSVIKPRSSALNRLRGSSFTASDKESSFTVRRKAEKLYEELEMMENVRQNIEARLKITLGDDLPAALSDGVALCHLANHARPRLITTIHVPSPAVPKLSLAKRRRNVENFLDSCVKLGVTQPHICSAQDILLEKNISKVAVTINKLLALCPNVMSSPKRQVETPSVKVTPSTLKP